MQVIIYTTNTSAYSNELRKYLQLKKIAYTEKLIDQNDIAKKEVSTFTQGYLGVPFTLVQKDDNTIETVVGFDKGKIDHILGQK